MKIVINDFRRIFAIQEEFSKQFPNLSIEFHAKPSKSGSAASQKTVGHSKKLLDCRATHEEGAVDVQQSMTIWELKDHFNDAFGLTINIVPKSPSTKGTEVIDEGDTLEVANNSRTGK